MTAFTTSIECIEYRVALIRPGFRGLLAVCGEDGYRLTRVSIPARVRPVPQLRRILENKWGAHGLIFDFLGWADTGSPCAVVELFSEDLPPVFRTVAIDAIAEEDLSEDERAAVRTILDGGSSVPSVPFSRPGWIDSAIAWVEDATRQRISSKLKIEQYNAGGSFTLIRFPMKCGQGFWLKATGEPNAHELPVTTFLSILCRGHVPSVIAVNPAWNAWIMPDEGLALSAYPSDSPWRFHLLEQAVNAMAEVQSETAGRETELLTAGAFDQRTATLRDNSPLLFERIAEAMSLQTSTRVPRLDSKQVDGLHNVFDETCAIVEELSIPTTVVHGDMNTGNILYRNDRCVFIDWCEAYVGFPCITLQHLLLLNQPANASDQDASDQILIDCYREVMNDVCDQSAMDRAIACMPLLAAASAIYGRGDWLQSSLCDSPHRQAHIRTLTRQMYRAAQNAALLDAIADHA